MESKDSRLAMELIANLRPREDIAHAYGYSVTELAAKIKKDKGFRTIINEARRIWESDDNAKARVRAKAALLIEDGLLDIYSILTDPTVTPNVRVSSFESLAKVADVSTPTKEGGGGGFRVVINLPEKGSPVAVAPIIEHED